MCFRQQSERGGELGEEKELTGVAKQSRSLSEGKDDGDSKTLAGEDYSRAGAVAWEIPERGRAAQWEGVFGGLAGATT